MAGALVDDGTNRWALSAPNGYLTIGRGSDEFDPSMRVNTPVGAAVEASALVAELFCSHTNVTVRCHQLEPGRLVLRTFDVDDQPHERQLRNQDEVFLAEARFELDLLLAAGAKLEPLRLCAVEYAASGWTRLRTGTQVLEATHPTTQWARWLVAAHMLYDPISAKADDGRLVDSSAASSPHVDDQPEGGAAGIGSRLQVPTVKDVRTEMKRLYRSGFGTESENEPGDAVRAALEYFRLPYAHLEKPLWRTGLATLFAAGHPDDAFRNFVLAHRDERYWDAVPKSAMKNRTPRR